MNVCKILYDNRTYVELKLKYGAILLLAIPYDNRTYVELKCYQL